MRWVIKLIEDLEKNKHIHISLRNTTYMFISYDDLGNCEYSTPSYFFLNKKININNLTTYNLNH